ncbi:MAG: peptide ABC transporter substrate-binding protein [Candidatus Dormiibacterota bacterium]
MGRLRWRAIALSIAVALLAFACGGTSGGGSGTLASNQTFSFPFIAGGSISTLDPGQVNDAVGTALTQEMFGGLLTFNANLKVVPFAATSLPTVSADGKTYTFHLRHDVKFWNGDSVTSKDVLYSWNRAAALQGSYATVFQPVVGYDAVAAGSATTMTGLTAPDAYTVVAKLQFPAGYWLTETAIWTANILDQKAVSAGGADTWWSNPQTAVGIGPFKLTQYTANSSLDFAPVKNWWNGSTGSLTHVHIDEGVDGSSAVKKFEAGGYGTIGPADNYPPATDVLRYENDPTKKSLLHIYTGGSTNWMGFNFTGDSPFAPKPGITPGQPTVGLGQDQGQDGRSAFSAAINRDQFAQVVCAKGTTCAPADHGLIPTNLYGSLGSKADPMATYDASKAKADYQKWDPTGAKAKSMKLEYNTSPTNDQAWQNVQAQLRSTLGVNVTLYPTDFKTLIADRQNHKPYLFRDAWSADYNHPQDWYDNLWTCAGARNGGNNNSGYCNPQMDQLVSSADQKPISQSLSQYTQAYHIMQQSNYGAPIEYGTAQFFTQKWVQGESNNGLYDASWTNIKILQH